MLGGRSFPALEIAMLLLAGCGAHAGRLSNSEIASVDIPEFGLWPIYEQRLKTAKT